MKGSGESGSSESGQAADVSRAIVAALSAENDLARTMLEATVRAEQIAQEAQQQAHAIRQRAQRRLSVIHHRCRKAIEALQRSDTSPEYTDHAPVLSAQALHDIREAIEGYAANLTGDENDAGQP